MSLRYLLIRMPADASATASHYAARDYYAVTRLRAPAVTRVLGAAKMRRSASAVRQ